MRILSQGGMMDVAYDLGNLSIGVGRCDDVERASIYFHSCSCIRGTRLAEYKSVAKAKKAMKMLHEAYTGKSDGHKTEEGTLYREKNTYECRYFQFPSDEELED